MIEDLLPYAPPAASWVAAGNCIAVLSGKEGAIRVRVFRMLVQGAVALVITYLRGSLLTSE